MKTHEHNQQGFSVVEIIIVVLIAGLLAGVGFFVYQKTIKAADIKTSTECFTVSVPAEYKVTSSSGGSKCQFAATLGSENTVLVVPFKDKVDGKDGAVAFLKAGSPNLADDEITTVEVGGKTAEMFAGFTKADAENPEKLIASYVVYGTGSYTPSGSDYTTSAFSIRFAFEPNDTSKNQIKKIVDSIVWN